MTQTPVQRQPFKWLIDLSSDDDKTLTMGRACLQAACRGSDRIGSLLNYFIFKASQEAKKQGLTIEGCKIVTLKLTLEEILRGLHHSVSKKTLISYLHKLNIWELVASQPYHREYGVNVENIDKTIKVPPPVEKKLRGIHAKGCNSTTLQPSRSKLEAKVVELQEKVVSLQSEVVILQSKNVELQHLIVILQSSDSSEASSNAGLTGILEALDSNRFLESNTDSSESLYIAGYREVSQNTRLNSSAILEEGALNALPVGTQQPAHPMEPNEYASIESTPHSFPIATPTTSPASSSSASEDMSLPCSNGHPLQPAMVTPDFLLSMATGNTSSAQHNGSSISSTPTPVGNIPSQPASPRTDAGSGISSDTSSLDRTLQDGRTEIASEVDLALQARSTDGQTMSEVVQGGATGLSDNKTEEKVKDKILPDGAENSTVPPKKSKGKKALEDITALPKPERPPEKMVWGVPKCLLLATYYRGYPCPSKRCEEKAKHGAISLIQQGRTEQEAEGVLRYMKCLDKQEDGSGIYDGWWEGKEVDVWHVAEHCAVKLREIERKKKEQSNGHAKRNGKDGQAKPSLSSFDDPNYRVEDEFYPDHHERSAHYATFS